MCTMRSYALDNYNFTKSLCWGNSFDHLSRICEGPWTDRVVHLMIGLLEAIPIIGQIISLFEQYIASPYYPTPPQIKHFDPIFPPGFGSDFQKVIAGAPDFHHYRISLPDGRETVVSAARVRPANLFFKAMDLDVTQPGSGTFFTIKHDHAELRRQLEQRRDRGEVVDFAAKGYWGGVYGTNHYRISYDEVVKALDSQHIYLSPLVSLDFYKGLKNAIQLDGMAEVPNMTLQKWSSGEGHTAAFLRSKVAAPYLRYTFYELGTQVVKIEDYRVFMDENGKIFERQEGVNDAFRLINMCGIRRFTTKSALALSNQTLMYNSFRTAIAAAQDGILIFPAVGMGVWGGDPELYWNALITALLESPDTDNLDAICVNPGHQPSPYGNYKGRKGDEFREILAQYKVDHPNLLGKLNKIICLGSQDVVQLAHRLKCAYPGKTVSLVNASDPDVILSPYVVGEYVNNMPHASTTEENLAAVGDSCARFETLTGVHTTPGRIHPLQF